MTIAPQADPDFAFTGLQTPNADPAQVLAGLQAAGQPDPLGALASLEGTWKGHDAMAAGWISSQRPATIGTQVRITKGLRMKEC